MHDVQGFPHNLSSLPHNPSPIELIHQDGFFIYSRPRPRTRCSIPGALPTQWQVAPSTSWVSYTETVNSASSTSTTSEPAPYALPPPATPTPKPKASDYRKTLPTIPAAAESRAQLAPPPRKKLTKPVSRWIRWQLWFNTYRWGGSSVSPNTFG